MAPAPQSVQTPAERRSAEAEYTGLVAKHAKAHAKLIGSARRKLRTRLPTAYEIVYEYTSWIVITYAPSDKGYEGVFGIRADQEGVKLFFSPGKKLPDPDKLLQGSGALAKYVPLESASTLSRPGVAKLIDATVALTKARFARSGKRPIIVRAKGRKGR